MESTSSRAIAPFAAFLVVVALSYVYRRWRSRTLGHIRGPPSPSWLFGHDYQFTHQMEVGELEFQWIREYGPTWRMAGPCGGQQLMTADPLAIQYALQTAGYTYSKRRDQTQQTRLIVGEHNILAANGSVHMRHRKALSPAFSTAQARSFLPVFQRTGAKLCENLKAKLSGKSEVVWINKLLARATLDVLGEAAFDYNFGSLDDNENHLAREYSNLFVDSQLFPSKAMLLAKTSWNYIPAPLLKLVQYAPSAQLQRLRRTAQVFQSVAGDLLEAKRANADTDRGKRDILSVLVRANESENPKARLTDAELRGQMQAITIAGHETTASVSSFVLWELARHPDVQARLRAEIADARERSGRAAFTAEELDRMALLNDVIKETLRFHPSVYALERVAVEDNVLPLVVPVVGVDGEEVAAIPVSKGTFVTFSFAGYNRLPSVWGADADEWNPARWARIDATKQTKLGVYANLTTFACGVRSCIGWRFALIEMQTLITDLVERFVFEVPADTPHPMRLPAGGLMMPIIPGKMELGAVMPLRVSAVESEKRS